MEKKYDLIQHPFNIEKQEDALLFRKDNNYEYRFTYEVFSKKIESTFHENKNFIEIEITNNSCEVISEIRGIHKFDTAADFFVPIPEESKAFYKEFHENLISSDLERVTQLSQRINEYLENNTFPPLPVPVTSVVSHFENYNSTSSKSSQRDQITAIKIRYGDPIPLEPKANSRDLFKSICGEETYNVQDSFLSNFILNNPIFRFKQLEEEYKKQPENVKNSLKHSYLKKAITLHAYFCTLGPWNSCWVKFGYDPSKDQENYKFQTIKLKSNDPKIQLCDNEEIINEVEKNKDWYLFKNCDSKNGFISEALFNFIKFKLHKGLE